MRETSPTRHHYAQVVFSTSWRREIKKKIVYCLNCNIRAHWNIFPCIISGRRPHDERESVERWAVNDAARDRGFTTKISKRNEFAFFRQIDHQQSTTHSKWRKASKIQSGIPTESGTQKQKTGRGQSGTGKNLIKSKMWNMWRGCALCRWRRFGKA